MSSPISLGRIMVALGVDLGELKDGVAQAIDILRKMGEAGREIGRDMDQAADQVNQAGREMAQGIDQAASGIERLRDRLSRFSLAATVAGGALLGSGTGLISALIAMAREYENVEISMRAMERALERNGYAVDVYSAQVRKLASEFEGLLGIPGSKIADAFTRFLNSTGDLEKARWLLLQAAGLHANRDMQFENAVSMLNRLAQGRIGQKTLIQLGLFDPNQEGELDVAQVLDAIQRRTAGALASLEGDVTTSMHRLSSALSDLRMAIGEGVVPIVVPWIERLTRLIRELTSDPERVERLARGLARAAEALIAVGAALTALGAIGTTANAILGVTTLIQRLGGSSLVTSGGLRTLAATIGSRVVPALAGLSGATAGVIGIAGTLAVVYARNFDRITIAAYELRNRLTDAFQSWVDKMPGWAQTAVNHLSRVLSYVERMIPPLQTARRLLEWHAEVGAEKVRAAESERAAQEMDERFYRTLIANLQQNEDPGRRQRSEEILRRYAQEDPEFEAKMIRYGGANLLHLFTGIGADVNQASPGDLLSLEELRELFSDVIVEDEFSEEQDPLAPLQRRVELIDAWMQSALAQLRAEGHEQDSALYRRTEREWAERLVEALQALAREAQALADAAEDPQRAHEYRMRSLQALTQANSLLADIRDSVRGMAEWGLAGGLRVSGLFDLVRGSQPAGIVVQSPQFVFHIAGSAGLTQGQMVSLAEQMYAEFTRRLATEGARRA